jgi:hypothetical protein
MILTGTITGRVFLVNSATKAIEGRFGDAGPNNAVVGLAAEGSDAIWATRGGHFWRQNLYDAFDSFKYSFGVPLVTAGVIVPRDRTVFVADGESNLLGLDYGNEKNVQ